MAAPRRAAASLSSFAHAELELLDRFRNFIFVDDQRRQQAHHILAGRDRQELGVTRRRHEVAIWHAHFQSKHQSFAAHLFDDRRMAILQLSEALTHRNAEAPNALHKPRRQHHIENGVADACGERVPAERRAMCAKRHSFGGFSCRKTCAERKSAAQSLGHCGDVGGYAAVFAREKAAHASDACLHLVENKQQAMLVTELAKPGEKALRKDAYAALALDRLEQHASGLRADQGFHSFQIRERRLIEAVDRRTEAFQIFGIAAGGDGRKRATVKRAFECNEAIAFRLAVGRVIFSRGLDRAFHRLGARIGEEHKIGEGRLRQSFGEPLGLWDDEQIRDVPGLCSGGVQRCDEMRMRVSKRKHGDSRAEIEVAFAVATHEPNAFAPLESEVRSCVRIEKRRRQRRTPSLQMGLFDR